MKHITMLMECTRDVDYTPKISYGNGNMARK